MGKTVTRCAKCQNCAICRSAGFTASEYLVCTRTNDEVDEDDGCTFGLRGNPRQGIVPYDIDISSSYHMRGGIYW